MSVVIKPTSEEHARSVLTAGSKPVLVDFSAAWCGPCNALAPVLEDVASERAESLTVVKLDVDEFPKLAQEAGIRSVPTLMILKDGKVLASRSGSMPKSALAAFVEGALK